MHRRSMSARRFGILYSSASTSVSDDLVTGSNATQTEVLAERERILAAQPGLEAVLVRRDHPEAPWLGLGAHTAQDILRRNWG